MRVHFDSFTLDSETRQLVAGTAEVRLTPKAFDLLVLLVQARPRVVSKRDLFARIWPGTHVVDANLNGLIGELRRALGDHTKEPRFIRTVHGAGFAFAADATEDGGGRREPAALRCWLVWDERRFVLVEGVNLLGRDPLCDVWLDASRVSREHARIVVDSAKRQVTLEDAGSTNGTVVAGRTIGAAVTLADRNEIEIGSVKLIFRAWMDEQSAKTERVAR